MVFSIVLAVSFVIASISIARNATQSCYEALDNSTTDMVSGVNSQIEREREKLQVAANLLAEADDITPEEIKKFSEHFETNGMIESVLLLLPDTEISNLAGSMNFNRNLDFEVEAVSAPYIADAEYMTDGTVYSYWAVPLKKEGETVGVLYGILNLNVFHEEYNVASYDGKADMYVIDGGKGKLIMRGSGKANTTGTKGNSLPEVEFDTEKEDFKKGRSGYMAYYSETKGEKCYAYYEPLGIKNWIVVLSVPESVAFEGTNRTRTTVMIFTVFEIVCLAIYVIFIMIRVRKQARKKEEELTQSVFMFEVQQILFDAHKDSQLIIRALEKVAEMLTAEIAFLVSSDGAIIKKIYYHSKDGEGTIVELTGENINERIPGIGRVIMSGKNILSYDQEKSVLIDEKDRQTLKKNSIKSLMIAPVMDMSNRLSGFVGVANMSKKWDDAIILECVATNFIMAITNLESYKLVKRMGTVDELTGLQNRNSYQQAIAEYMNDEPEQFCCIYIDANGLHEMNNRYGHKAGDDMLICIGEKLQQIFPDDNSYRIGGDEFVILCTTLDDESINVKLHEFAKEMMEHEYYVSMGMAWMKDETTIEKAVSEAEKRMYEDKRLYYKSLGDSSKARI